METLGEWINLVYHSSDSECESQTRIVASKDNLKWIGHLYVKACHLHAFQKITILFFGEIISLFSSTEYFFSFNINKGMAL